MFLRILLGHGFFLVAGLYSVSLDRFICRVGCVLVLCALRVLWTRAVLWRAVQAKLDAQEYTVDRIIEYLTVAHPDTP